MLSKWFHIERPNPRARMRLFCFPYAGGGASVFRGWSSNVPADVEVVSIRLPGRESRINESPIRSLDSLLRSLHRELYPLLLEKPFAFFGHSNGGLICYELTLMLHRDPHSRVPELLIISGKRPPRPGHAEKNLNLLSNEEFIENLKDLGGAPSELLENTELMELMLPALRADFALSDGWDARGRIILSGRVSIYYGADDSIPCEQMSCWQDLFFSKLQFCRFDGGHFFIRDQQESLLTSISSDLSECLKFLGAVS